MTVDNLHRCYHCERELTPEEYRKYRMSCQRCEDTECKRTGKKTRE